MEGISVRDYLKLGVSNGSKDNPETLLEQVGLESELYLDRFVDETLSGGERKRIELAAVMAMTPRLAILDEPDSGIDALSIDYIKTVIQTLVRRGATVLLITHHDDVASIADRTSALCSGRILRTGDPEKVTRIFRNHCQPCTHVNDPREEVIQNV
ncbi:MAG: ATP-binding cassette domain-containing protein [candidate division KSB1 bacterium]|nr:ATP-binding cassette domain-containing protein [candidate division KSB1 bacterium]